MDETTTEKNEMTLENFQSGFELLALMGHCIISYVVQFIIAGHCEYTCLISLSDIYNRFVYWKSHDCMID